MIVVVDVGNTNTVLGVYNENEILYCWRINTKNIGTSDEVGILILNLFKYENLNKDEVKGVVIGSVVPTVIYSLKHAVQKYFNINPFIIEPGIKTGICIKYDNPKELGCDRIANAVAAYELYGGPIIVVDFGTATKFCVVSQKGEHLGGVICPGIKISAEALFRETSRLPKIELKRPENVINKNTLGAIQSGIIYGFEGMVRFLIESIKKEMGDENIKVIATGGLAGLICNDNDIADEVDSNLTLEGMRILYYLNN